MSKISKISKIQNLITKYMKLQQQFDNLQHEIDNVVELYEDSICIYERSWYGETLQVGDIESTVHYLRDMQTVESPLEDHEINVPLNVLRTLDVEEFTVVIDVEEEPDPYEDYNNPVCYLRFYADVLWSEEQQEQRKKECKQKMAGLALDMHKVQEELLELGVDILGE